MASTGVPYVFLDIGGTLLVAGTSLEQMVETLLFARRIVRSPDAVRAAVAEALAAHRARDPRSEDRERPASGRREMYAHLFRALALEDRADSLAAALWEMSFDPAPPVLAPGAHAALELLRGAGARAGVISNWDDSLDDVLARTGIAPYVEVAMSSFRAGWSKPNRRIFEAALAAAGVKAAAAWHIGDDLHADVRGALEAGMRAVLVEPRPTSDGPLPAGALRASRVDEAVHLLLREERGVGLAGHGR